MGKSARLATRARRLGLRLGKYGRNEKRRIRDGGKPVNWYLARGAERVGEYVTIDEAAVEVAAREGRGLGRFLEDDMGMTRTRWSDLSGLDEEGYATALNCCRGDYQRDLLHGVENLSGTTITGRTKTRYGQYGKIRATVIRRWRKAGLTVSERIEAHGARILVLSNKGD